MLPDDYTYILKHEYLSAERTRAVDGSDAAEADTFRLQAILIYLQVASSNFVTTTDSRMSRKSEMVQ
jgi:hypothetical protein